MSDTLAQVLTSTPSVAQAKALLKAAQDAERKARMNARKRSLPPFEILTMSLADAKEALSKATELDDAGRPLTVLAFRPFVQPSVENGYGALIVASSEVAGKSYVAAGALKGGTFDGRILEVKWSARVLDPETSNK